MRTARVIAVLCAVALAAACSSSSQPPSMQLSTPATVLNTASSVAVSATTTPTVAPTVRLISKQALEDALLPLASMPTGYGVDPSPDSDGPDKTFCNYTPPSPVQLRVSHTYVKGAGANGQVISVGLRQYASPAAARAQFDKLVKVMQTCHQEKDSDGTTNTYSLVNTATVAEGTIGIRIDFGLGTALQTFALTGACLASVGLGGVSVDPDVIAPLIKGQVARYEKVAIG